jgi:hypothetical protein
VTDAVVLGALVLVGAAWLLCHAALLMRAARNPSLPTWLRWLGWLPPLTPVAGWLGGARVGAVLWTALAVAYLALRGMA